MKRFLKLMAIFTTLTMAQTCFIACSKNGSFNVSEGEASTFVQACKDGDYEYVKKMLELSRSFTEAKNARGDTGLMHASSAGHKNIVDLLLKKDAYVNTKDKDGDTALQWAVAKGHTDVMKLLIKNGANINISNNKGMSLLMWAAKYGQKEAAEILLNKGANVNAKDGGNSTALMIAAAEGYKDIVELLIEKGADINARDNVSRHWTELSYNGAKSRSVSGSTALDYAVIGRHTDIADLLKSKGAK